GGGRGMQWPGGGGGRLSSHLLEDRVQGRCGGLRNELILSGEVLVEPAMGQPGGLHQVGQPGGDDPLLTELARGGPNDALASLGRRLPRLPHVSRPPERILWIAVDIQIIRAYRLDVD